MRKLSSRACRGALTLALTLIALAGASRISAAQLPNASPAATALGGAYTARADGYDAVAWNPANLGMPGHTSFSLTALAVSLDGGMDPISLNDIAPYSGKDLPASVRSQWLQTVQAKNGENLSGNGGVTEFGLSIANIGFQIGTFASTSGTLSPDMWQALLFGNAGRTGSVEDLRFAGSTAGAAVFTTGGLSYGRKLLSAMGHTIAAGATVKYIVGNGMAMAQDNGSDISANSLDMKYPVIYTRPDSSVEVGSGFGLDLGGTWKADKLTIGATIQNVLNTFAWDSTKFLAKPGNAFFDGTTNTTDFNDQAFASAPQALRDRLKTYKFKPAIAAGMAYDLTHSTTVSADVRKEITGGIATGPDTHLGAGIEYRGIPLLSLRAGAAYITGGFGVSGGFGLRLGPYELGVGGVLLSANGGKQPGLALNVLSIH